MENDISSYVSWVYTLLEILYFLIFIIFYIFWTYLLVYEGLLETDKERNEVTKRSPFTGNPPELFYFL